MRLSSRISSKKLIGVVDELDAILEVLANEVSPQCRRLEAGPLNIDAVPDGPIVLHRAAVLDDVIVGPCRGTGAINLDSRAAVPIENHLVELVKRGPDLVVVTTVSPFVADPMRIPFRLLSAITLFDHSPQDLALVAVVKDDLPESEFRPCRSGRSILLSMSGSIRASALTWNDRPLFPLLLMSLSSIVTNRTSVVSFWPSSLDAVVLVVVDFVPQDLEAVDVDLVEPNEVDAPSAPLLGHQSCRARAGR